MESPLLRLIRTGGHVVTASPGKVEVRVYRTGRAYGHWLLALSPGGDEVVAWHSLPTSYGRDGGFRNLGPDAVRHPWATDVWRKDPVRCLASLLGKTIACEVAPMVNLALIHFAA